MKMKKILLLFISFLLVAVAAQAQNDSYIIQRGDVLDVTVMEHPEFSLGNIIVLPDGYVQYPALGSVQVAGMSSLQLTDSLTHALEKYVVNPMVTIYIRKIQNQQLNIYGYVNKPGQYQIFEKIDLFSAIGLAGGLKSFKKVKTALIIRADRTVQEINMQDYFVSADTLKVEVPVLNAGDTVYIKEPKEVNWAKLSFFTTLASLLVTLAAYTSIL